MPDVENFIHLNQSNRMKPTTALITFLLFLGVAYWTISDSMPSYREDAGKPEREFSTDRALEHVRRISEAPHAVGFPAHGKVREYLVGALEGLGLEPELQSGYTAGDWGNFSKAVNIVARIPGSAPGKALVLLSHYDSNPHSSFGASDAGSGVATILEGLRAFLARGTSPKNDIIVLFTDAEELGLNGADLFVNAHPWSRDAGLVLNFEARGSGGPSIMLIETNRGNARLIEAFSRADPGFPVANSLFYSIYKILPNDTDLTVFREDGDIEGFNFAFIDDHYDYHTALDTFDRLDRSTLAHQGSYLMPLLDHFSQADLGDLKSLDEYVYFNVPVFGLIFYPFEWIWPMMALAMLLFILILGYGFRAGHLSGRNMAAGLVPMGLSLLVCGLAGYFAWPLLRMAYPSYQDMLHGFTYNGHLYIAAISAGCLGACFWAYARFGNLPLRDLLVAPVLLWLLLSGALSHYLPGAAFFLLPVFGLMFAWMILLGQERPNTYILVLLSVPAIWIFVPFIQMFPVGLGLKMLLGSSLLCALLFFLLLPVFGAYPNKKHFALVGLLVFLALLLGAHFQSGFSEGRPKPTSLLYVKDLDTGESLWATNEKVPSEWTRAYLGPESRPPEAGRLKTLSSKYSTGFSFVASAPDKPVPPMEITVQSDTVVGEQRRVSLQITHHRNVNRLEVFTNDRPVLRATVNGIELSPFYLEKRRSGRLLTHYVSGNEPTELSLHFPAGQPLELSIYEASNDLLANPLFSIPPRPAENLPMPFVLNDAVLLIKSLRFE